ncbi:MAG: hypothetical protein OEV89_03195 [Desulfobulbaceae bacterium]|nr:hypothetical protein [Desulfobulbaceae bacterium]
MRDKKKKYNEWERELLEFVNSEAVTPPSILTERVKSTVKQDFKPPIWKIFAKLAGMQAVCATLTLFFCPQFEIGFAKYDYLAHLVQHTDGFGFMIVCGVVFLGGGAVMAPFFLSQAETKAIEKSVLIYFPTVALLAVLFFFSLGTDVVWPLAFPWFLGGTFGSLIGFEFAKYFRFGANKARRQIY